MAALAADVKSGLPIQRRRTLTTTAPSPVGGFRSAPPGALRVAVQEPITAPPAEPVVAGAVQARRWADYTPTASMHAEDKSARMVRKGSEGPSLLFPPTPSPTVSPMRYANFGMPTMGMPLPGLPEGSSANSGSPQQQISPQQQMTGMVLQHGMAPAGQVFYVQMPAQMTVGGGQIQTMPVPAGMLLQGVQAGTVLPSGVQGWEPVVVQGAVEAATVQGTLSPGTEPDEPPQDVTHLAGRQLFSEAMGDYLDRPPQPVPPLPSPGSAAHGTGRCNPCAWFWKPKTCQNGANCSYCHLCPEGELKNRKKAKVAALRMGAIEPAEASGSANGQQQPAALKLTSLI